MVLVHCTFINPQCLYSTVNCWPLYNKCKFSNIITRFNLKKCIVILLSLHLQFSDKTSKIVCNVIFLINVQWTNLRSLSTVCLLGTNLVTSISKIINFVVILLSQQLNYKVTDKAF